MRLPDQGVLVPGATPPSSASRFQREGAEVRSRRPRRQQTYPTATGFTAFLTETGQTVAGRALPRSASNADLHEAGQPAREARSPARHRHPTTTPTSRSSGRRRRATCGSCCAKTAAHADAAKKALEAGQSWNTVAKKYSIDPTTKNKGGLLTGVTQGQQDAALDDGGVLGAGQQARSVRSRASSATTCSRSRRSLRRRSRSLAKATTSDQADAAQPAAADQAPRTRSTIKAQEELDRARPRAAGDYAMADCKGYKAPKTAPRPAPPHVRA